MSKGLGRVEKDLLEEVNQAVASGRNFGVQIAPIAKFDELGRLRPTTRAERESRRRAAKSLEKKGLVVIYKAAYGYHPAWATTFKAASNVLPPILMPSLPPRP